jgi:hypothetical protein
MLRAHAPEMLARLNTELGIGPGQQGSHGATKFCTSGHDAAVATVEVMRTAFETIKVDDILATYVQDEKKMWDEFGQKTVELLAEGARALAMIWESAWKTPGNTIKALGAIPFEALVAIYEDKSWAPSMTLDEIGVVIGESSAPAGDNAKPKKRKRAKPRNDR